MKKTLTLLLSLLVSLSSLHSCKTSHRTLDLDLVAEKDKQKVYEFGISILETCKTKKIIQLSQKVVTKKLSELSLDQMQYTCDNLNKRNGNFIDMKLIEVIDDTFVNHSKIFRFKANFERNEFLNEVRIWLMDDGKIGGIILREWKDAYKP